MTTPELIVEVQTGVAVVLHLIVAARMYTCRLYEKARYFFTYIVWQNVSTFILYTFAHTSRNWQFYSFWINNLITMSLGLLIIVELFDRIFGSYNSIRHFAKMILLWSFAVLMLIGVFLAHFHKVAFSVPYWTVFLVTERSIRVIQLGLILTLFGLSKYLHLRWKNYLFGIALGFGFYALLALTGLTIRMYYGKLVFVWEDSLLGTAYCLALAIWTFYVLQTDAIKIPIVPLPSHELERWDEALARLLHR